MFQQYNDLPERKENSYIETTNEIEIDMKDKDTGTVLKEFKEKQDMEYNTCSIDNLKVDNILSENLVQNVMIEKDDDYELDI